MKNPKHTNFLQQVTDKSVKKEQNAIHGTKIVRDFYQGGACIKLDLSLLNKKVH